MSGSRGPLSMPANVRELHGNRNKRNDGVQAVVAEPSIPSDLDGEAKREWRRVVPELKRLRLLARTDRGLLTAYCTGWSEYVGRGRNTVFYVRSVLPLAKELGLTPNARLRMRAPEETDVEASDLD